MGQIRTECAARGQSVPEARVGKSIRGFYIREADKATLAGIASRC